MWLSTDTAAAPMTPSAMHRRISGSELIRRAIDAYFEKRKAEIRKGVSP